MTPRASAICIGILLNASIARAEIDLAGVEDVEDLSLADLLEKPIVTASRYEQAPGSSPMLVSSVEADQIAALGYRTLGDALRSMRGVYLSNDRNYSYLGTRGFAVPGDYNTRFALSIDGHRMNDPVYSQATPGLELGLPLIAIDRIEMLRGGAWSVYGQNALLGAVQVITATGASRPGLEVRGTTNVTAETFGDPSGRSALAPRAQDVSLSYGTVARGFDLFVAANYQIDPGLEAIYMPELASDELSCVDPSGQPRVCDGVVIGGDSEEVGGTYLALRTGSLTFHALASRRRKEAPTASFVTLVGEPIETFDDHLFADSAYQVRGDRADLDAHLALDYYDYRGDYPYDVPRDGYAALPDSRILNEDHGRSTWVTGELRGRYKWARLARHITDAEVAAGSEAQWQAGTQLNFDGFPEGRTTYIDRDDRARMLALTSHATARAFDRVVGFAALRGDYYPDAFGLTVNPQAGFVLDLGEQGRLRGSISRGFRAPNLYELYWSNKAMQRGGAPLQPERSETRELSYERYFGRHVRVLAVGYTQLISDLIALQTLDNGDQEFSNEGTSQGHGAELELEARWDALQLRGSFARQYSWDENDEVRVNSPRSLAAATALVPLGSGALFAIETNYIGSRKTLAGPDIAPVFLTTASLTLRDVADGIDLSVGVRNLFDARTGDPGSEEHIQSMIPGDPRTVWLRLTARLGGTKRGAQ